MMHSSDKDALDWFINDILCGDGLLLHSNEIGDLLGDARVLEVIDRDNWISGFEIGKGT